MRNIYLLKARRSPGKAMQRDLDAFLAEWGAKAEQLGWSPQSCNGLASAASRRRFDAAGLVTMLQGKRVVAMDADRATIEVVRSGVRQTFIRHSKRRAAEAATVTVAATSRDLDGDMKSTFTLTPIERMAIKQPARRSQSLPMKQG